MDKVQKNAYFPILIFQLNIENNCSSLISTPFVQICLQILFLMPSGVPKKGNYGCMKALKFLKFQLLMGIGTFVVERTFSMGAEVE